MVTSRAGPRAGLRRVPGRMSASSCNPGSISSPPNSTRPSARGCSTPNMARRRRRPREAGSPTGLRSWNAMRRCRASSACIDDGRPPVGRADVAGPTGAAPGPKSAFPLQTGVTRSLRIQGLRLGNPAWVPGAGDLATIIASQPGMFFVRVVPFLPASHGFPSCEIFAI